MSFFTVALGLSFGVITALSNLYKMRALNAGPMHITLLVTTSSMIIPTMSGVFFGERFSPIKLILVVFLIGFIYLSFDKTDNKKTNGKWLFFCVLAFLFQGSIGVLQKIHQSSACKGELNGFLLISFVCSLIYSRIRSRKSYKDLNFRKKHIIFAMICGLCTYTMNFLNLRLSGLLPSQFFFPIVNGSAIILSSLMSVLFFKEHLSKKQTIGLIGGITSLIVMCFVG
ncbi:MAG: EamA family transporter [Clostridia bacterium]|nr:EamA family transporter [Clostridia bacterium]